MSEPKIAHADWRELIRAGRELLNRGEAPGMPDALLDAGEGLGLWFRVDGDQAVGTHLLAGVRAEVSHQDEAVAAVLSVLPELRSGWLRILAGRLRERGLQRDVEALSRMIEEIGPAARSVRLAVRGVRIEPTGHADLETALLGTPADHASALPKLLRIVKATAPIVEGAAGRRAAALSVIDPLVASANWVDGRLLLPPAATTDGTGELPRHVLSGCLAPLGPEEQAEGDSDRTARLRWVLSRPWVLLLAQIVFTQEAWGAEVETGSLYLELDRGSAESFMAPERVDVVVTLPDKGEIVCGSLAALVRRVLRRLGVCILASASENDALDHALAGVVRVLLQHHIWRFDSEGRQGTRPGYVIDGGFSADCYRIFGSRYFNRGCSRLTAAIRAEAGTWAREKDAHAKALAAKGAGL